MQTKIAEILENLKDEANIQPIIFELFEKSDSEAVKKTIEDLQRSLDSKNEEVKKNLSANHEHLFSCTDMVEQLRDFSNVSSAHVGKIHKLSQQLLQDFASTVERPIKPTSTLGYQVAPQLFVHTCFQKVVNLTKSKPALAVKCFLMLLQHPVVHDFDSVARTTWVSMVSTIVKSLASCLQGQAPLTQDTVNALYNLVVICLSSTNSNLKFPKSQILLTISRTFALDSFEDSTIKSVDADYILFGAFDSVAKSLGNSKLVVDPIEFLKLLSGLENRTVYSISGAAGEGSQVKRACDDLFNHSLGMDTELEKLGRRVGEMFQTERAVAHESGAAKVDFLSIYSKYISQILGSLRLVHQKEPDAVQFNFEFVRRFYEQRGEVEAVEEQNGIAQDNRLSTVIKSGWADYCRRIISVLENQVNFAKIASNMPDEFRTEENLRIGVKETANKRSIAEGLSSNAITCLEFLSLVQEQIHQAVETLINLVNIPESSKELLAGTQFQAEAKEKFAETVESNFTKVLELLSGQNSRTDIQKYLKVSLLLHVILVSSTITQLLKPSRVEKIEAEWTSILQQVYGNNTTKQVFSALEAMFRKFKINWTHELPNSYLAKVAKIAREREADTDLPTCLILSLTRTAGCSPSTERVTLPRNHSRYQAAYPSLLAFVASSGPSRVLPIPADTTFDSFTHEELLSQVLP